MKGLIRNNNRTLINNYHLYSPNLHKPQMCCYMSPLCPLLSTLAHVLPNPPLPFLLISFMNRPNGRRHKYILLQNYSKLKKMFVFHTPVYRTLNGAHTCRILHVTYQLPSSFVLQLDVTYFTAPHSRYCHAQLGIRIIIVTVVRIPTIFCLSS